MWVHLVAAGIVVSRNPLPVTEGASATSGFVTVNKSGGMAGAAQDLTFRTSTWNTGQTMVAASGDTNAISGDATIAYTTVNTETLAEYDKAVTVNVAVQVMDDDERGHGAGRSARTPAHRRGSWSSVRRIGTRHRR